MKNLFRILCAALMLSLFINTSCVDELESEDYESLITVWNGSPDTVVAFVTFNYPDTCIPDQRSEALTGCRAFELKPYDASSLNYQGDKEREDLLSLNSVIQVFVIKNSNLGLWHKYGGKYLSDENLILKRYELTHAELDAMDWVVMYE